MPEEVTDREPETTDERLFFRPGQDTGTDFGHPASPPKLKRGRYGRRFRWRPRRQSLGRALERAVVREAGLGTPFLFVPVALLAGAVTYFALPAEPEAHNLPLAALALALPSALAGNRAVRRLFLVLLIVVGGMLLAQWHTRWAGTQMLGSAVTTRLTGRIVAIEERATGRTRFTIDVLRTERPELRFAPSRLRATAPGGAGEFRVGDGIRGVARLLPASGPARPGGYDFAFHNFYDGIGSNGFFYGRPERIDVKKATNLANRFGTIIERLRSRISHEIRSIAPGRAGAVSAALVTGDKAPIPEEVNEALRVSGLAHILSISGLHMALVAATVMFTLRFFFALSPQWSSERPVRKYAAAAALAATGFYLFLAGAAVATQRSFVMLAIMLAALTFDRNAVTMRNLALAAVAVIVIAPHEVAGPGFQMSFAATAALIAAYASWQDMRTGRASNAAVDQASGYRAVLATIGRYALGLVTTSLIAGLATGIFAAYHFGRVAPYGLLANLAAMPIVSIAVMPLAILGVVLMPFGLHGWAFKGMAVAVEQVIRVAEAVAGLSPPLAVGFMPALALVAFAGGLALICLLSTRLRWVALPFFAVGAIGWVQRPMPVAVISEDARQFAIVGSDSRAHVNRSRPSSFILEQWTSAYGWTAVVKPNDSDLMACGEIVCTASLRHGESLMTIAYVTVPTLDPGDYIPTIDPMDLCSCHDLVIYATAPSPQACADGTPVISAQMLALKGSAEIFLDPDATGPPGLRVHYALSGPTRPWLDHRRYSRAARNLAEWKPHQ